MAGALNVERNTTVTFLPNRLNRQPVVVRGLTASELWIVVGLSAVIGMVLGILVGWLTHSLPMAPTLIVMSIALGVYFGGAVLRRHKRGRPDTWLYRQLQWWLCQRSVAVFAYFGARDLITRSGYWTTRRTLRQ